MSNPHPLDGPRRELVRADERATLEAAGGLIIDKRRSRPRYFDGRFLAAADLTNDQGYLLTRQADLGRAAGWGVINGLSVRSGSSATGVVVRAGQGLTPAGEPVVLSQDVSVDLMDLRRSQLLDGHLGLREERVAASRVRTGAFVLALRPVEYTANPRKGYPTTIHGQRETEDHDIVEATAITLVPWPTDFSGDAANARRRIAREVFVAQSGRGLKADLLPLAMVWLDGVTVSWVDEEMVRRPVGAELGDTLGLGIIPRAVRAAHVRQYDRHLQSLLAASTSRDMAAASWFDALPPVGRMPLASLNSRDFTQGYFPATIDVDLAFVPADELPAIIDEALMLPPLDLTVPEVELSGVAMLVMVPVERSQIRRFKATLEEVRRPLTRRVGRIASARTPLLALSRLRLPSVRSAIAAETPADTATSAWTTLFELATKGLASDGLIWYARRRSFNYRAEIEGDVVDIDIAALDSGSNG